MEKSAIFEVLDQLQEGKLTEYLVSKDSFLTFRSCLVTRPDFKHFRGIAQRNGDVIYQYLKEPRS